jgi:predicted TIM-barrel fold metal-dependent hydrolase
LIIDSHVHVFPFLGQAPGFEDQDDHLACLQREMATHHQPVRRRHDNALVPGHTTWSPNDLSPAGREPVSFRVGRFGRMEWTKAGVDYYKQWLPPSLEETASAADYIVAEMDYAGVDIGVLHNDALYGKLNDCLAEAGQRHPGRFLLTAHIDETALDTAESLAELYRAVSLGHRGLFISNWLLWLDGYRHLVDHPSFDPFWSEVERLQLVVYWAPGASPQPGMAGRLDSFRRWTRVIERHSAIRTVVPNSLSNELLFGERGPLPGEIRALVDYGNFCIEVLFPIRRGGIEEYPYRDSLGAAHYLYDAVGPQALVWGSDLPNVLRHCTYAQSLEYLRRHATFIPSDDMDLILGRNLARLFRIGEDDVGGGA